LKERKKTTLLELSRAVLVPKTKRKHMKNFVVIGGGTGIGKALTEKLAEEGHSVLVISRESHDIDAIPTVEFHKADITQSDAEDWPLPDEIHGLAYCPGSINLKPFHRIKPEVFQQEWDLNVMGAIKVVQACLPGLKEANGSAVFFSTVAVQTGMPFHASIAAAKGALEGLTRSLAAEYAPAVRFNCIAPSLTNTPLANKLLSTPEKEEASAKRHPLNAVGQPEDIANMAAHLLGDSGKWITGQIIGVDGGMGSVKTN
jgi:NAD(P)-dependent dehydrogenase (short-subunit alcohol dehydrogenase family)